MHSYLILSFIILAQLCVIGGIAISVSRWMKRQPDQLIARYQAVSTGLRICLVLLIGNIILDFYIYLSDHKLPSPSLIILIIGFVVLLSTKRRFAQKIEKRQQIQT